jgi:hypothetical protein
MEGPDVVAAAASWNRRDEQIAKVYAYYLNALKESNALDFDDLLLKTVELFEQSERVREKYSTQFRFVMVDEYQDTKAANLLIRRLAGSHGTCAWSAIPTSRLQVARRISQSSIDTIFPRRRRSSWSATIDRRRSSSTPPRPSSAKTGTAKTNICGPIARAASASCTTAAVTSSRKRTSSPGRPAGRWPTTSTRWLQSSIGRTRSRERSKMR